MVTKRQRRKTKELERDTLGLLKEKLAVLILFREELEMQDKFAEDLAEKKDIIQQIIIAVHQIQALKTVIRLFAEEEGA